MATFITRLDAGGSGPTLAVKDLIDMEGLVTSVGCRAVAEQAVPAAGDAACLAGARSAGARIVGKTNLHELAFGTTGVNEWFGTPRNPFDPALVPGGSSSGSAVAVADGEADLAFGSDTGGSIRIPAAFCGVSGLKTSFGRISLEGVWPLAPSMDSVGPMARQLAGVVEAMALLEPGFSIHGVEPAGVLGRVRPPEVPVDPAIESAVDSALAASGLEVVEVAFDDWDAVYRAALDLLVSEAAAANAALLASPASAAQIGAFVRRRLEDGAGIPPGRIDAALAQRDRWKDALSAAFGQVELLVLPSVPCFPPTIEQAQGGMYNRFTVPFNFVGVPALSLPVPTTGRLPASLQLVGPLGADELCCATAGLFEGAIASMSTC